VCIKLFTKAKEQKMVNKKSLKTFYRIFGIAGMALIMVLGIGCNNPVTPDDSASDDSNSNNPASNNDPYIQEVKKLPAFEGSFVASKADATALVEESMSQINAAISTAIASSQGQEIQTLLSSARASSDDIDNLDDPSGTYNYDGVTVTIEFSKTGGGGGYIMTVEAVIDGTYDGYKISGRYYSKASLNYTSDEQFDSKNVYDYAYTVSKNGKGMKLVLTGDATISSDGASTLNLNYSIYDNSGVRQYNYSLQV
jgi:hypothetical protein